MDLLDGVDIDSVDIIIRPYEWELRTGAKGVKAYLQTLYIKVREDDFESKYYDLEEC